jgi:diguanylate cyclase (GGDEF)-like protein
VINLQFSPTSLPSFISAIIILLVAIFLYKYRRAPVARSMLVFAGLIFLWEVANGLLICAGDKSSALFLYKFEIVGLAFAPIFFLNFVFHFIGISNFFKQRYLTWIAFFPILCVFLIFIPDFQGLFFSDIQFIKQGLSLIAVYDYGIMFQLLLLYINVIGLTGFYFLFRAGTRLFGVFRKQIFVIIAASLLPFLSSVFYLLGNDFYFVQVNIIPLSYALGFLILIFGVYRYQLIDVIPLEYETVLNHLDESVLILNHNNQMVEGNYRAAEIFNFSKDMIGKPVEFLIEELKDEQDFLNQSVSKRKTIAVLRGQKKQYFDLRKTLVLDTNNQITGKLLQFQDISSEFAQKSADRDARKNAETRISELEVVTRITGCLNRIISLEDTLDEPIALLSRAIGAKSGWLFLVTDKDRLLLAGKYGVENKYLTQGNISRIIDHSCFKKILDCDPSVLVINQPVCRCFQDEAVCRDSQNQSIKSLPIYWHGKLIGGLNFLFENTLEFNQNQRNMLSVIVEQIGAAAERIRLQSETFDTLAYEQKLSKITHIISSELDLEIILANIVKLASELVDADAGALGLISPDGSCISYPYVYNFPDELSEVNSLQGKGLAWKVIETGETLVFDNYNDHPDAEPLWSCYDPKAVIVVPVTYGQQILGALGLFNFTSDKKFDERAKQLIESIGLQAGSALHNSALFNSEQIARQQTERLIQASSVITSELDVKQILNDVLKYMDEVIPSDSATIFMLERNQVRAAAVRGYREPEKLLDKVYPADDPYLMKTRKNRLPLIIDDVTVEENYKAWGDVSYIRSWLLVPMRSRNDVIGFLSLDNNQIGGFSAADANLAQAFADQAAISIDNARLFEAVQQLAATDSLTGIFNRREFLKIAERDFNRSKRYNHDLSLLMIDIDDFKKVNDSYGHLVGDRVLVELASIFSTHLRVTDVFARYGGEEFIALLPETNLDNAFKIADRLCDLISKFPIRTQAGVVNVTVSIGVSSLDKANSLLELISYADFALYEAKNKGKNQAQKYH